MECRDDEACADGTELPGGAGAKEKAASSSVSGAGLPGSEAVCMLSSASKSK
jgi:hypothetical protein